MNAPAKLSLAFEPGLTSRHPTMEDCIASVVHGSRLGVEGCAARLDMAPSELSRRLNAHVLAHAGDPSNRPLRVSDLIGIMDATGDFRPIYWLAERYLRDPESQRTAAIQQLAMLAPLLANLAEQAGLSTTKGRK